MHNYQQFQNLLSQPYQSDQFKKQILAGIFRPRVKNFELLSYDTLEHQNLTSGEKEIASSVYRYGSLITADDKRIDLYEIVLRENRIIERNKIAVGSLVKNRIIGNNAVFASFVYPDGSKKAWRFSFIAHDSVLEDGEIKQVETNPKRYTYILGPRESCRTAAERFHKLSENSHINLADIQEAFSVEKISKQFFKEYKEHYLQFVEYLDVSNFKKSVFEGNEKAIRDFSKKLLGRIVFLYFLQKKGWLGVPLDGKWGDGDSDFLYNLFNQSGANDTFYAAILTRLFFDTLNSVRENDICELIEGQSFRIPYLNGGLFEKESNRYDFLTFPRKLFFELFEFFNRYNFTIYEDSPEEHTMAVDPEMLGHIFENLLEDNKDKGAYYTPKEIVHYMTQESLIEYLFTKLNTEHVDLAPNKKPQDLFIKSEQAGLSFDKQKDNISREDIEHFIKQKETTNFIKQNSAKIDRLLDTVKICDPAIGSGAFPMGLLHEIYNAKQILNICITDAPEWNPAKVKENIIQNSIYGVDIEKGAVDIARLRFWLSLIVDEEKPRPLPNLDYKIVVGNSLVPKFEDEVIEIDWDLKSSVGKADEFVQKIQSLLKQIVSKQKNYFKPGGDKQKQKKEIRDLKINLLINQLTLNKLRYQVKNPYSSSFHPSAKDRQKDLEIKMTLAGFDKTLSRLNTLLNNDKPFKHFDWKLDFPDVMNENVAKDVGFDIVIANPPYISNWSLSGANREMVNILAKKYTTYLTGHWDIFVCFVPRSIELLKSKGTCTFILPTSFYKEKHSTKVRQYFVDKLRILELLDFEQESVFENVARQTGIFQVKKEFIISNKVKLKNGINLDSEEINQSFFKSLKNFAFKLNVSVNDIRMLEKLNYKSSLLGNFVCINTGVVAHSSKNSPIKFTKDDVIFNENKDGYKHYVIGSNISPYHIKYENHYIDYDSKSDYFHRPKFPLLFESPKIIIRRISGENNRFIASYDEQKFYSNDNLMHIVMWTSEVLTFQKPEKKWQISIDSELTLKYILAILCSKLITYYFSKFISTDTLQGTYSGVYFEDIRQIPIKPLNSFQQIPFIELVDSIIENKNFHKETAVLENKIDLMLYKLYQLAYDEVLVVDPEFYMSREEYVNFSLAKE